MKIFTEAMKKLAHRYVNLKLSPKARDVMWVSGDRSVISIKDMEPTHAKHIVAMIKRNLDDGMCAYMGEDGRIKFAPLMENLVDNEKAFTDEQGRLRSTDTQDRKRMIHYGVLQFINDPDTF